MKDKDTQLLAEAYQKVISERTGESFYKIAQFYTDELKFEDYPNYFDVQYKVKRNYVDDSDYNREYGYGYAESLVDEDGPEISIKEYSDDDPETTIREEDEIERVSPNLFKAILDYASENAEEGEKEY
jgi:hypothetical protein